MNLNKKEKNTEEYLKSRVRKDPDQDHFLQDHQTNKIRKVKVLKKLMSTLITAVRD